MATSRLRPFRRILHATDFSAASRPALRKAIVRTSGLLLDFGVPAERIVALARARRADVIVMGTHGRTGVRRAILGSVASRVVSLARCPVLMVHT